MANPILLEELQTQVTEAINYLQEQRLVQKLAKEKGFTEES